MRKKVKLYGKEHGLVKLPKNAKAEKFIEGVDHDKVKIPHNNLWYVMVEKDVIEDNQTSLHLVKYNNIGGVEVNTFVNQVKEHYINTASDKNLAKLFENIQVVGTGEFSIIKNIPDVEIKVGDKDMKMVSKIANDLIKLLAK